MLTGREFLKRFHCKLHLAYSFARHKKSQQNSDINFEVYAESEVGNRHAQTEPHHIPPLYDLHPYLRGTHDLDLGLDLWRDWPRMPRPLQEHWGWVRPAGGGPPLPRFRQRTDRPQSLPLASPGAAAQPPCLPPSVSVRSAKQRGTGLHVSVHGFTHWRMALHKCAWFNTVMHDFTR